jgi:hypothetical protein
MHRLDQTPPHFSIKGIRDILGFIGTALEIKATNDLN